jgi:WD40 repeat protein
MADIDFEDLDLLDKRVNELCRYIETDSGLQVLTFAEMEPKQIRSLNLTNTGITSLSELMLSQTSNLEALDLSNNMITDMSNIADLHLPHLKKLNLSENSISDFTFLSQFQSIEELDISGNNYDITVPYWVVTKLPKLKKFNDEDVTEIRKYISMAELQVITNIDNIFNDNFESTLNETESGFFKLKSHFTENLFRECGLINEAKSALKHKVEQFFDNKLKVLLRDITNKVLSSRCLSNNIEIKTNDEKQNIVFKTSTIADTTESNDPEVDILAKAIAEEIGVLGLETNIISLPEPNLKSSDSKSSKFKKNIDNKQMNKSVSFSHLGMKREFAESLFTSNTNKSNHSNTFMSYEPLRTLREHSHKENPNDSRTPIWDIQFKPKTRRYSGNEIVATCGGNIVNIIDLKSLSVVKRYEDNNSLETFNCIAWRNFTIIIKNAKIRDISLLAIGCTKKEGKHSNILLLNENNMNDCFKIASHTNSVNCLLFHPKKRNLLFSGSTDRKIILWDLDWTKMTPTSMLSSIKTKKLLELDSNNRALSLVFSVHFNVLIVSGEDGIVLIKENSSSSLDNRMRKVELPEKTRLVDGLVLIDERPNLMAFRYKQRIIIADLEKMVSLMKIKESKGNLPLFQITQLRYSQQKCVYVYLSIQSRLLSCGDPNGKIFLYFLNDSVLSDRNTNLIEPNEVLQMPIVRDKIINNKPQLDNERLVFVNIAAISPNQEYIVSGTNTNLICIWKKIPETKISKKLKSG